MNSLINRQLLASKISKRTGIYKKDCLVLIEALIEEMVIQMKSGEGVHLPNLGKFEYYVRGEASRLDMETGEKLIVPPATRIRFIPCKDVKYGVQALDWHPYVSDYQKEGSAWYKKYEEMPPNEEDN